jgi:hypothetical protein
MDIVERLIAYRDRDGRSRMGRDLLAEAANEITELRGAVRLAHSKLVNGQPSGAKDVLAAAADRSSS